MNFYKDDKLNYRYVKIIIPHLNIRVEGFDSNQWLVWFVSTGNSQLQVAANHETWRHIAQLERGHLWQLLRDSLEYRVVLFPGHIDVFCILGCHVIAAKVSRLVQVATVRLLESGFFVCGSSFVHH